MARITQIRNPTCRVYPRYPRHPRSKFFGSIAVVLKSIPKFMIPQLLLIVPSIYLLCGAGFAIPFLWLGVGRINPTAAHGSWGFRILIIPGTVLLWPFLLRRWLHS